MYTTVKFVDMCEDTIKVVPVNDFFVAQFEDIIDSDLVYDFGSFIYLVNSLNDLSDETNHFELQIDKIDQSVIIAESNTVYYLKDIDNQFIEVNFDRLEYEVYVRYVNKTLNRLFNNLIK